MRTVHDPDAFSGDIDVHPGCRDEQRPVAPAAKHAPLTSKVAKRILGDPDHGNPFLERAMEMRSQAQSAFIVQPDMPVHDDRVERCFHFIEHLNDAGELALIEPTGSIRGHPGYDRHVI